MDCSGGVAKFVEYNDGITRLGIQIFMLANFSPILNNHFHITLFNWGGYHHFWMNVLIVLNE